VLGSATLAAPQRIKAAEDSPQTLLLLPMQLWASPLLAVPVAAAVRGRQLDSLGSGASTSEGVKCLEDRNPKSIGQYARYPEFDAEDDGSDQELMLLLDERARQTISALEGLKEEKAKERFRDLHNRNMRALRAKRRIVSHELVAEIHRLLAPFESKVEYPPNVAYLERSVEREMRMRANYWREIKSKELATKRQKPSTITPEK
jgi:hypothetical protein